MIEQKRFKDEIEIRNYNNIPMNGYNLKNDLEYLKHHNETIVNIMIKQNKKAKLDNYDYDFSRFINTDDHSLIEKLTNSSDDDIDDFIIQYF